MVNITLLAFYFLFEAIFHPKPFLLRCVTPEVLKDTGCPQIVNWAFIIISVTNIKVWKWQAHNIFNGVSHMIKLGTSNSLLIKPSIPGFDLSRQLLFEHWIALPHQEMVTGHPDSILVSQDVFIPLPMHCFSCSALYLDLFDICEPLQQLLLIRAIRLLICNFYFFDWFIFGKLWGKLLFLALEDIAACLYTFQVLVVHFLAFFHINSVWSFG